MSKEKRVVFFEGKSWYHRIKELQDDLTTKYGKKGGFETPEEAEKRAGVIGVCMEGKGVRDIAQYLNSHNVGMMGHHFFCPGIQKLFQIEGVARLSLHYWNTEEEIDYVADLLRKLQKGV